VLDIPPLMACPISTCPLQKPLRMSTFQLSVCFVTGQRKVYWQNLREEPIVFINGQPFVVRESDQPFSNLEYTGEDWVWQNCRRQD